MSIYAKIDPTQNPPLVINIQHLESTDPMDPNFTWIDVSDMTPQPCVNWTYSNSTFTPAIVLVDGSVPSNLSYMQTGSSNTFTPFTIYNGQFTVSISNNIITIGCQTYNGLWLRYSLYQILVLGVKCMGFVYVNCEGNLIQAGFAISLSDAQLVLTALETINFY